MRDSSAPSHRRKPAQPLKWIYSWYISYYYIIWFPRTRSSSRLVVNGDDDVVSVYIMPSTAHRHGSDEIRQALLTCTFSFAYYFDTALLCLSLINRNWKEEQNVWAIAYICCSAPDRRGDTSTQTNKSETYHFALCCYLVVITLILLSYSLEFLLPCSVYENETWPIDVTMIWCQLSIAVYT